MSNHSYTYVYKVKNFNGTDCIAKSYYLVASNHNQMQITVMLDELYKIDQRNHMIFNDIDLREDYMVVSPTPLPYTVKELNMCGNMEELTSPILHTKRHVEHAIVLLNAN